MSENTGAKTALEKNWVDRRLDRVEQVVRDSPASWHDLLVFVEDALNSYEKRCPHGALRIVSKKRLNGTAFRASFEKGRQFHDYQQPVLEIRFQEDEHLIFFSWSQAGLGKDGRFSIEVDQQGETTLIHKGEPCSPDRASEIILSGVLFPE